MSNQQGSVVMGWAIAVLSVVVLVMGITWFVHFNNNRNSSLGRGDAPVRTVNSDARKVYQMPDRFSNVAMFCDEFGNSVYVTTKSDYSRGIWAIKDGCQ